MMMSTTNKTNISCEGSNSDVPSDHPIHQDRSILDCSFFNTTTTTTDINKNSNNNDNVEDTNDQGLNFLSPNTTAPVDMWTKQFYDVSFTSSPSSPRPFYSYSSTWSPSSTLLTSVSNSIPDHNERCSSPPQSILKRSRSLSPSCLNHTKANQNNNNNDKTDCKNCYFFSGTTFPTTPVSSSINRLFQTPIGTIDFSMKRRKTTAAEAAAAATTTAYNNEDEDSQGDRSSMNGSTTSSSNSDDNDLSSSSVVVDRNIGDIGNTDVVRDVMEAFQKNLVFLAGNDTNNNNNNNEKSVTTDQTTWINKNHVTEESQEVSTASTLIEMSRSDSNSLDQADPSNDIAAVFDSFRLFENL